MGYRGKLDQREQARRLRAEGLTMPDIADRLGVSRSSVSLWTRDVPIPPGRPRRTGARRREPNALQRAKQAEIAAMDADGARRLGSLDDRSFLVAGTMLYIGEGSKRDGVVKLANSDPLVVAFFCRWLRRFFPIDESRLRVALYLHEGLDLPGAVRHWSEVTGIPPEQFTKPYRATPKASIRHNKHEDGCCTVSYACSRTHRAIMGLGRALLSSDLADPG